MSAEYTVEESGHVRREPVIHLLCRRADGSRRHLEVEGFHPYFYISVEAFEANRKELLNDGRVRHIEVPHSVEADDPDLKYQEHVSATGEPVNTLFDQPLVKVTVGVPKHVSNNKDGGLVEYFEETWEADVFFVQRFLISEGIKLGVSAPTGGKRVHVDDLDPLAEGDEPDVLPRTVYLDIEVETDGTFPDPLDADFPVTSISAFDNYDEEYKAWILEDPEWTLDGHLQAKADWLGQQDIPTQREFMEKVFEQKYSNRWDVDVRVYGDEAVMLDDFHEYVGERSPDILTGWNAHSNDIGNGFDFPYLINRSKNINAWAIEEWSELDGGSVFTTRAGTAVVEGMELFDLLEAYEKTQIHELKQKKLDYVAAKELGYGKEDIGDLDEAYKHDTCQFLKYNIRDTEALVEIDHSQDSVDDDADREPRHGILKMYDHLRSVTGQLYGECHHNISMIDMLFLRDADAKNMALPTSEKPSVDHYHGAKVFTPYPGKSENVFYPDLASLYPNLFWATNMSPETIIGNEAELQDSGWTKDDCFVVYWDPRDWELKKDDDAADYDPDTHDEALYVLKPDIKKGFVRDSVGDLIDMKYEYKGSDKYEAVKRVTNSVYGVMGDKDTYGKGFRLFNVRIAEAITLAGRKVLEFTAEQIKQNLQDMGYDEAYIAGGDTDSAMCSVPGWDIDPAALQRDHDRMGTDEEFETPIFKATDQTNAAYDGLMAEKFNISVAEGYEHKMKVEVECAADALYFKSDYKSDDPENVGKKKRYSQTIVWDEDDGIISDVEAEHTGWDLIRSDTAEITAWAQAEVLSLILMSDTPKDDVLDFLEEATEALKHGRLDQLAEMKGEEVTIEDVGIPKSIASKPPDQYGFNDEGKEWTPSPHIRGAKYATQNIAGEDIKQGAKPYLYPIQPGRIGGDYPEVYSADTLEDGDLVDAISVENPDNLPPEARIDWGEVVRKLLKKPIEDIIRTMGWTWADVTNKGRQTGLGAFA